MSTILVGEDAMTLLCDLFGVTTTRLRAIEVRAQINSLCEVRCEYVGATSDGVKVTPEETASTRLQYKVTIEPVTGSVPAQSTSQKDNTSNT